MASAPVRRPGIVTFVVVLIYLAALADIVVGIVAIFLRYVPGAQAAAGSIPVALLGAAVIILGLLQIGFASGIARGSRFARGGIAIVLAGSLLVDAAEWIVDPSVGPGSVIGDVVVILVVLLPLFAGRGARYFAPRPVSGA